MAHQDSHWRGVQKRMRQAILNHLQSHPWFSATEVARALSLKTSSVSSLLVALVQERVIERKKGCGPRGGYGYHLPIIGGEKSWYERLDSTL